MNSSSFNKRHNHAAYIKHVTSCISENANTLVVKHHNENPDKAKMAEDLYGVNYQILESWLRCLTDLRNRCAHYSRLYYWIFPATPKMPSKEKYIPTRRLFAQLYMLKLMYPEKENWNNEFLKLGSRCLLTNKNRPSATNARADLDTPRSSQYIINVKKPGKINTFEILPGFLFSRGRGNRTPVNGFGDRRTTAVLFL